MEFINLLHPEYTFQKNTNQQLFAIRYRFNRETIAASLDKPKWRQAILAFNNLMSLLNQTYQVHGMFEYGQRKSYFLLPNKILGSNFFINLRFFISRYFLYILRKMCYVCESYVNNFYFLLVFHLFIQNKIQFKTKRVFSV